MNCEAPSCLSRASVHWNQSPGLDVFGGGIGIEAGGGELVSGVVAVSLLMFVVRCTAASTTCVSMGRMFGVGRIDGVAAVTAGSGSILAGSCRGASGAGSFAPAGVVAGKSTAGNSACTIGSRRGSLRGDCRSPIDREWRSADRSGSALVQEPPTTAHSGTRIMQAMTIAERTVTSVDRSIVCWLSGSCLPELAGWYAGCRRPTMALG